MGIVPATPPADPDFEDAVKAIGPPTSIGEPLCECLGLLPELRLNREETQTLISNTPESQFLIHPPPPTYLKPGDGDLGLPMDPDCDADCVLLGLEMGLSCSRSFRPGLGGALDSRSSSPSPIISGEELLLVLSILSEES